MSATRYKKLHIDIFICIEMARERNRVIKKKHPVYSNNSKSNHENPACPTIHPNQSIVKYILIQWQRHNIKQYILYKNKALELSLASTWQVWHLSNTHCTKRGITSISIFVYSNIYNCKYTLLFLAQQRSYDFECHDKVISLSLGVQ